MTKITRNTTLPLALGMMMSIAVAAVGQSEKPESKQPNGTIQAATRSAGLGVGVTGGEGTLTFEGKDHRFSIEGLTFGDIGVGEATVKGNIYNLTKLEDFAGKYAPTKPSFQLGGAGPSWSSSYRGLILANDKGVVAQIWVVEEGPHSRLKDGPVEVRLR
jgi:hypothetical protein